MVELEDETAAEAGRLAGDWATVEYGGGGPIGSSSIKSSIDMKLSSSSSGGWIVSRRGALDDGRLYVSDLCSSLFLF